jgi:YD repeat-containing protein
MRNLQGKLTWVIVRPFLLAILLFLPLSATYSHAQCWSSGPGPVPGMTMTPQNWTAGQSYLVTVSSPSEPNFFYDSPFCNAWVIAQSDFYTTGTFTEDPNVTVSNLTYISPSEIQFNVAIGADAIMVNDYWVLVSSGNELVFSVSIKGSATNLGPCTDHGDSCAQVGAPINLTNGNVWVEQRDYSVPGLGGGLGLVRTWNSLAGVAKSLWYAGMFGLYWTSTYEESLTGPDSNGYLTYWRGDGSSWSFYFNSALDSYTLASPPNVRAQLVQNPVSGGFTLTLADGTQRIFNNEDLLAAIIDRNNNQTTIAYNSSNLLTSVTSPGGSTLTFTYGNSNQPSRVTRVQDSVGTVATYTYDSSSRLTLVSYPDGSALSFTYDPNASMLLSVTDSRGKLLEAHTYDSLGRGLSSTRANGVDSISLVY